MVHACRRHCPPGRTRSGSGEPWKASNARKAGHAPYYQVRVKAVSASGLLGLRGCGLVSLVLVFSRV
eukprot:4119106-Prymnesium_polylepis.1